MMFRVLPALALALSVSGCNEPKASLPEDGFAFAAFGDAPYSGDDMMRVERLIEEINSEQLEWVVNVGDILWFPCSDAVLEQRLSMLRAIRHPVVYTPGDNEWADCHEGIAGRYQPLDRLAQLRRVFFPEPGYALGSEAMPLDRQQAGFPENARWTFGRLVFATMHVVGSHNARNAFPGRTVADDEEVARREAADLEWLHETFAEARRRNAPAVVLMWHAAPGFGQPPGHPWRAGYETLLETLEEEVAEWARPVLLIHGDDHQYLVDHPLVDRRSGAPLTNLTRLEVMGTPDIGWVRVVVTPGTEPLFRSEPHYVERGWWYLKRLLTTG